MNDLNSYITKTIEHTTPRQGIPPVDRTAQSELGLELARRRANESKEPVPVPKAMPPIVPIAN